MQIAIIMEETSTKREEGFILFMVLHLRKKIIASVNICQKAKIKKGC